MREYNIILNQIRKLIQPTDKQREKLSIITKQVLSSLDQAILENKVNIKRILGGSYAKDTWLNLETDIDIFILFPIDFKEEEFEKLGIKIGKTALKNHNPKLRYSEHPYVEGVIDNVKINIVPCYDVEIGNWISSADRTPFHSRLIESKFNDKMRSETRLLKLFMKSLEIYGAEIKIKGFSGYVCEVLILKYKKFTSVLEAASDFSKDEIIKWDKKSDILNINNKTNLTILDPIDNKRNLGAAISNKSISKFIIASRLFLNKPDKKYFQLDKKVKTTKSTNNTITILFAYKDKPIDTLWGLINRTLNHLRIQLEKMSFSILKHSAAIDEKGNCALIFLFKELYIPEQEIKIGPEVYMKESLEKFLSKNNKNNQLIWIGEDSKINVLQKRDYTYAKNFIRHLLTNKIFSSGIAPDLITELEKSYRIIEGNEINQLSTKYIWLKNEVNELIANDKIFER